MVSTAIKWWQVLNPAIYLVESIREFPAQEEMAEMIRTTGLDNVSYSNMTFGIACIHRGKKLQ